MMSLSCELQFVLKRLGVVHTGTWTLSYFICLESHPDILNCWAGDCIDEPLFLLECTEKIYLKHATLIVLVSERVFTFEIITMGYFIPILD